MVVEGEKLKIATTIPLSSKIHEREIAKTDLPATFNAGATLGPINQTKMERIWTKHKQITTTLKPKVFVAMSGGVDSSVAAALMRESGLDVFGIHIKMWSDPEIPCTTKEDRYDAMRVAAKLNIPFETWDLTKEYKAAVVTYMIREYGTGRTPNSDVMCNRYIKFGIFLKKTLETGADFVATGHYVRLLPEFPAINYKFSKDCKSIENLLKVENCKLKISKDINKDQSYFLWTLTQKQLKHCLFPIGQYTKPEVRALARKFGLPTADKKDSQGICFIGEIDMREFLKKYIPERRGLVLTTSGKVIGEHMGLAFYTIGQREGLGIGGGGIPYYVTAKDFNKNMLVVAEGPYDEKLFSKELMAGDINWISGVGPKLPLECEARIRYRQPLQSCCIEQIYPAITPPTPTRFVEALAERVGNRTRNSRRECHATIGHSRSARSNELYKSNDRIRTNRASGNYIRVRFSEAQRAITPGQSIVFYHDGEMLGGGIIA